MKIKEKPRGDALSASGFSASFDAAFFQLAMDCNPNLVFVKDEASRFVYANRALHELFPPEKRERIIGFTTAEDFTSEEAALFLAEDRRAFRDGRSEVVEEIVDYAGRTRTFKTQKIGFRAAKGQPMLLGISTDISELAQRERDLVQANATLENFAALAAHDLRSPLSTFIGCVSLIQHDKDTVLGPNGKTYVEMMERSARNLAHQISGLLDTYKARNRNTIECAETDLNILLEEIRFNLRDLTQRTRATIVASRLPTLNVEANLFRHLLMNLIENSIKYRGDATPIIVVKCVESEAGGYLFSLEDNGIGIGPADEKKVFGLHGQVDGHGSSGAGVGLGLTLCQNIVELHGGRIWIDHEYRGGCRLCFTVRP